MPQSWRLKDPGYIEGKISRQALTSTLNHQGFCDTAWRESLPLTAGNRPLGTHSADSIVQSAIIAKHVVKLDQTRRM